MGDMSGISKLIERFQASTVVKCACKTDMAQLLCVDPISVKDRSCVLLSFSVSRI
jgi:hypothetical protein